MENANASDVYYDRPPFPSTPSTSSPALGSSKKNFVGEKLMVVEVSFGENQSEDILVTSTDDPEKLAEAFVLKHKLKKGFVYVIANHIKARVEEARLARIQEMQQQSLISSIPDNFSPQERLKSESDWEKAFSSTPPLSPQRSIKRTNSRHSIETRSRSNSKSPSKLPISNSNQISPTRSIASTSSPSKDMMVMTQQLPIGRLLPDHPVDNNDNNHNNSHNHNHSHNGGSSGAHLPSSTSNAPLLSARAKDILKKFKKEKKHQSTTSKPNSDIGNRLYEDGLLRIINREKLKDKKLAIPPPEEWSCAKCGTFHILKYDHDEWMNNTQTTEFMSTLSSSDSHEQEQDSSHIPHPPLSPTSNHIIIPSLSSTSLFPKKYRRTSLSSTMSTEDRQVAEDKKQEEFLNRYKKDKICTHCGWNQSQSIAFKPANIAISSNNKEVEKLYMQWLGSPRSLVPTTVRDSSPTKSTSSGVGITANSSSSSYHLLKQAHSTSLSSSSNIPQHPNHHHTTNYMSPTAAHMPSTANLPADATFKPTLPEKTNKIVNKARKFSTITITDEMSHHSLSTNSPSRRRSISADRTSTRDRRLSATMSQLPPPSTSSKSLLHTDSKTSHSITTTTTNNVTNAKMASSSSSASSISLIDHATYLSLPVEKRLSSYQRDQVMTSQMKKKKTHSHEIEQSKRNNVLKKTQTEVFELVTKLQRYQINSEARRKELETKIYTQDSQTRQPLFKPQIPEFPTKLYASDTNSSVRRRSYSAPRLTTAPTTTTGGNDAISIAHSKNSTSRKNIGVALLEKDELRKQYIQALCDEYDKKEKLDIEANQIVALPQSMKILQASTEHSIEEMYKLLITCTQYLDIQNNNQLSPKQRMLILTQLASENNIWKDCSLDLNLVQPELMIEEVHILLLQIKEEYEKLHMMTLTEPTVIHTTTSTAGAVMNTHTTIDGDDPPFKTPLKELPLPKPPTMNTQNQGNLLSAITSGLVTPMASSHDESSYIDYQSTNEHLIHHIDPYSHTPAIPEKSYNHSLLPPPPPPQLSHPVHEEEEEDIEHDLISNLSDFSKDTIQRQQAYMISMGKTPMVVTFNTFRKLVYRCLRKRETGKAYIFAPRKRPEVALQMVRKERAEETFKPAMNPKSLQLGKNRMEKLRENLKSMTNNMNRTPNKSNDSSSLSHSMKSNTRSSSSIINILYAEAEKIKQKTNKMRNEIQVKENAELLFKPVLIKAPKSVVPRKRAKSVSAIRPSSSSSDLHSAHSGMSGGRVSTSAQSLRASTSTTGINQPEFRTRFKKSDTFGDLDRSDLHSLNTSILSTPSQSSNPAAGRGIKRDPNYIPFSRTTERKRSVSASRIPDRHSLSRDDNKSVTSSSSGIIHPRTSHKSATAITLTQANVASLSSRGLDNPSSTASNSSVAQLSSLNNHTDAPPLLPIDAMKVMSYTSIDSTETLQQIENEAKILTYFLNHIKRSQRVDGTTTTSEKHTLSKTSTSSSITGITEINGTDAQHGNTDNTDIIKQLSDNVSVKQSISIPITASINSNTSTTTKSGAVNPIAPNRNGSNSGSNTGNNSTNQQFLDPLLHHQSETLSTTELLDDLQALDTLLLQEEMELKRATSTQKSMKRDTNSRMNGVSRTTSTSGSSNGSKNPSPRSGASTSRSSPRSTSPALTPRASNSSTTTTNKFEKPETKVENVKVIATTSSSGGNLTTATSSTTAAAEAITTQVSTSLHIPDTHLSYISTKSLMEIASQDINEYHDKDIHVASPPVPSLSTTKMNKPPNTKNPPPNSARNSTEKSTLPTIKEFSLNEVSKVVSQDNKDTILTPKPSSRRVHKDNDKSVDDIKNPVSPIENPRSLSTHNKDQVHIQVDKIPIEKVHVLPLASVNSDNNHNKDTDTHINTLNAVSIKDVVEEEPPSQETDITTTTTIIHDNMVVNMIEEKIPSPSQEIDTTTIRVHEADIHDHKSMLSEASTINNNSPYNITMPLLPDLSICVNNTSTTTTTTTTNIPSTPNRVLLTALMMSPDVSPLRSELHSEEKSYLYDDNDEEEDDGENMLTLDRVKLTLSIDQLSPRYDINQFQDTTCYHSDDDDNSISQYNTGRNTGNPSTMNRNITRSRSIGDAPLYEGGSGDINTGRNTVNPSQNKDIIRNRSIGEPPLYQGKIGDNNNNSADNQADEDDDDDDQSTDYFDVARHVNLVVLEKGDYHGYPYPLERVVDNEEDDIFTNTSHRDDDDDDDDEEDNGIEGEGEDEDIVTEYDDLPSHYDIDIDR